MPLFRDASFKPPAKPIDSRTIFAVDASMQRFIDAEIVPQIGHKDPRRALLDALGGKLRIDYDSELTRTAAQAFAAREGNCMSLAIMAAALAKQLGIRVTYQEVFDFDTWSRDGGFEILSQHVNLVLGTRASSAAFYRSDSTPMIVDFLPPRQVVHAVSKPIPERTVVAMYMNNRAAELMVAREIDRAYFAHGSRLSRFHLRATPLHIPPIFPTHFVQRMADLAF